MKLPSIYIWCKSEYKMERSRCPVARGKLWWTCTQQGHTACDGCCSSVSYLLIKLTGDALCPLQVEFFTFSRPINVSQLYTHLTHQETIIFIGPIYPNIIIYLFEGQN